MAAFARRSLAGALDGLDKGTRVASMTDRQFLKFSLVLPFFIPAITLSLRVGYNILFTNRRWGDLSGPRALAFIETHLLFSVIFGGVPYLIFAIFAWRRIKRRPLGSSIVLLATSPLIVACLYLLLGAVSLLFVRDPDWRPFAIALWPQVLGVGYSYVVVVLGTYWLLRRGDCLKGHLTTG